MSYILLGDITFTAAVVLLALGAVNQFSLYKFISARTSLIALLVPAAVLGIAHCVFYLLVEWEWHRFAVAAALLFAILAVIGVFVEEYYENKNAL